MKQRLLSSLILTSFLALSACGPQAFVPGTNKYRITAGSKSVPAKVDILIGIDDKGAMQNIYPNLASEFNAFAAQLESNEWNYRFVSVPLSQQNAPPAFTNVVTSHYDTNWYTQVGSSSWLEPYLGASGTNTALGVLTSLFTTSGPSIFFPSSIWSNNNNGLKPGIQNQVEYLERSDVNTGFLRSDALLAVLTVSNSRDTSGGSWIADPNNPLQTYWNPPVPDNLPNFQQRLRALKPQAPSLVKYYSMVSPTQVTNSGCRGQNALSGYRYQAMASAMGGADFNICQYTLPAALDGVRQHLEQTLQNMRRKFVLLEGRPNVSTLTVSRNGASLPIDANNGWTYVDQVQTQYLVDGVFYNGAFTAINLEQAAGYMIELHGTAKITGSDYIDVSYENYGATSAY